MSVRIGGLGVHEWGTSKGRFTVEATVTGPADEDFRQGTNAAFEDR